MIGFVFHLASFHWLFLLSVFLFLRRSFQQRLLGYHRQNRYYVLSSSVFFWLRNVGEMAVDSWGHEGRMASASKYAQKLVVPSQNQMNVCSDCLKLAFEGLVIILLSLELLLIIPKNFIVCKLTIILMKCHLYQRFFNLESGCTMTIENPKSNTHDSQI